MELYYEKIYVAVLAMTAALGVGSVSAANPFSDVTPSDWAYQSVAQLAAAGVINGYPDGTFKGQNNITRFEMAQMIAKAMANESRANAEQQAMINRLADEYSTELNNLGVRVSNLENKIGNVKITGDARARARSTENGGVLVKNSPNKKSLFDYRARVQFEATVNDNTKAVVRVRTATTGDNEFGDATANSVGFDRMYVNHKFGKDVAVNVGRYGVVLGEGLLYNDEPFDGAGISYQAGKVNLGVNYGAMTSYYASTYPESYNTWQKIAGKLNADVNPTVTILQARAQLAPQTRVDAYYVLGNKNMPFDVVGAALDTKLGANWWLGGEYAKIINVDGTIEDGWKAKGTDDAKAWVVGLGYGTYNMAKQGTWGVKLQYFYEGENSPIYTSRWAQVQPRDFKGWLATVDYALYKNVGFAAYYGFNNKKVSTGEDWGNYYRADLNFKF